MSRDAFGTIMSSLDAPLLDEGGDHVCVVTEPVAASASGRFQPFRLAQAAHLVAGHDSAERPDPPTERAR